MCGIAGYKINRKIKKSVIEKMVSALAHRGPDSEGYYNSELYTAGMRRLRINDLMTGDQPLYNEDKSIVLVYNGEIYNYNKLKRFLSAKGHTFRTRCDGEVVCHLYEEIGESLFEKLDGMFAIALWSEKERRLILARDIPGEKPLYYAKLSDKEIIFASEIKSIEEFPNIDLTINKQALWDFPTFLWIPEPDTIYESIKALPRSHFLIADSKGIDIQSYRNNFNYSQISLDDGEVLKETRRVVEESVKSRLLSDVPVGSFLSGGLDSSIVASIASKFLPELTTFCIAFEDLSDPYHGRTDESIFAKTLADSIGSKHHVIRVTAHDFRKELYNFCYFGDQPSAVSSGLGILSIARAAKENGIKVLLSGDGADECFGGYSWYFYLNEKPTIDSLIYKHKLGDSVSFQNFGLSLSERLKFLYRYPPQIRAWAWHYYAAESEKVTLFNDEYFENKYPSYRFFNQFKSDRIWSPEDFIRQDREFYFPYEMLRKVDRMTMAYSVEGRVPFAAPAVLNHANKLKYSHFVRGNNLKWALRYAFADLLSDEVINRPKHGFNVPIDHWLKGDWSDLVEDAFNMDSALMKAGIIHKNSFKVAKAMLNDKDRLNGHTIFCFVMLNLWLEKKNHGNHC